MQGGSLNYNNDNYMSRELTSASVYPTAFGRLGNSQSTAKTGSSCYLFCCLPLEFPISLNGMCEDALFVRKNTAEQCCRSVSALLHIASMKPSAAWPAYYSRIILNSPLRLNFMTTPIIYKVSISSCLHV